MLQSVDWPAAVEPLLKKYKCRKFPLEYHNIYQLLVMVVLSAQDSDKHINQVAPPLFAAFPNMASLAKAKPDDLHPYLSSVRNFGNKSNWLIEMALTVQKDDNIPQNLDGLTQLAGIGRKSANVILREAARPAEGIIVDLHVERVAHRLGIAKGKSREKIEKEMMEVLPPKKWDAGMAMSFLGREICRPTNPKCEICPMRPVCEYYHEMVADKKSN